MTLDIGIQSQRKGSDPLERDLVISLEYVEYSYLLDVFKKLQNKTGVLISDCDDARLQGGQLALLHKLVEKVIENVKQKPKTWQEHVGFQVHPKKEIFETLVKSKFIEKMMSLLILIEKAQKNERTLFFFGD
jgi:hypothetical protein